MDKVSTEHSGETMNNTEICALALFFIGLFGLIARRNIIKTIISISIMEIGVILFFLSINNTLGTQPPIGENLSNVADPIPQALMITAIVVGIAVTAVAMSMFIGLYHKYGTTNWKKALQARKREEG